MSKRLAILVLAAAALPSGSWEASQEHSDETTPRAVQIIAAEFDRAARERDLEAWLGLFAEDAVVMPAGEPPIVGKAAIVEWGRQVFDAFTIQAVHTPIESRVQGTLVISRGKAKGRMVPRREGDAVPFDNTYLHIYRRQPDGSLRYWWGAFNADGVAPADPE